jgi:hypothetical protein
MGPLERLEEKHATNPPSWCTRSNGRQAQSGCGVTNGIKADPRGFTGAYVSVEKDTMAYTSGT